MLKALFTCQISILLIISGLASCQKNVDRLSAESLSMSSELLSGSEGLKLNKVTDQNGVTVLDFQKGNSGVEFIAHLQTGSEGLKNPLQTGSEGLKLLQNQVSPEALSILYEISVGQENRTFLINPENIKGDSHSIRLTGLPENQTVQLTYKQFIDEETEQDISIKQVSQKNYPVVITKNIPEPKFQELSVDGSRVVKSIVVLKEKDPQAVEPGDSINFIGDMSIPDNMQVKPGESFEKVWAIQNASSDVIWQGRTIENVDENSCVGDGLITPEKSTLILPTTFPGEVLLIRANMKAASQVGTYRSTWKMKNSQGMLSFPGLSGIYAQIRVVDEEYKSLNKNDLTISTQYVRDNGDTRNLPLNFVWPTNKLITVRWVFKNNTDALISGWKLKNNEEKICPDGFLRPQKTEIVIPDVEPGQEVFVDLGFTTPDNPGTILSTWDLLTPTGVKSGPKGVVQLTVETPPKVSS